VNGGITVSAPTFFGTNPAEVRDGEKKGLRLLGFEEDPARALVSSLSAEQRRKGVLSAEAPNDIATMNMYPITPLSPGGIVASELDQRQRETLMTLIEGYTGLMAPEIASARLSALRRSGVDHITFGWAGEVERGRKHYYRVQGPSFLIEYDNTQNDGNHVHSVWRDFNGDFGRDLLRQHLAQDHQ
jgi:hypothetical protein